MMKNKLYDISVLKEPVQKTEPLTYSEIAKAARVDRGTVKRVFETGEDVRVSTLRKIAAARGYRLKIEFEPAA